MVLSRLSERVRPSSVWTNRRLATVTCEIPFRLQFTSPYNLPKSLQNNVRELIEKINCLWEELFIQLCGEIWKFCKTILNIVENVMLVISLLSGCGVDLGV